MLKPRPTVDTAKIREAISQELPISITTYTLPHEMELFMSEVLHAFLTQLHQDGITQYLTYCLNELVVNAKKANTKRVYFSEKNLDLFNKEQYELGMQTFKNDTLENINYYLKKQKDAGLFVKLILQAKNNTIKIEVRNNAKLTQFETERIQNKIEQAQKFNSIEDALSTVLDDTEGAGLGLVIIILMLEKIGMTVDSFQSVCENDETITRIILPINKDLQNNFEIISEEFSTVIEDLPQFPENITKLSRLLSDPEATMQDICNQIMSDVAISAELLKIVNSAAYGLKNTVKNIQDAVKFIGTRGIQNILYSIGSMRIFASMNKKNLSLWNHAYKAAFFSFNLAKNLCSQERNIIDDAFTCGLLHDMGKLIFETTHPDFLEKIKDICVQKNVPVEVFEKVLAGANHGEIGAKIAQKWNFPDTIVDVIHYHHSPELAPIETRKLCYLVYLSDAMIHYAEKSIQFDQIQQDALAEFNIQSEEIFQKLSEKLEHGFVEFSSGTR